MKKNQTTKSETKQMKVFKHLKKHGSITTWKAIEDYGATRLSAIIFNLRKLGNLPKNDLSGFVIKSIPIDFTDRLGNKSKYVKYVYVKNKK